MEPLTPQDVQAALDRYGMGIHIQEFAQPTRTAQEAADAIGTELGSIVKSLCFTVLDDFVLILCAGDRMIDAKKVAELYGVGKKKVRIASTEDTIRITGYAPGGVPPIGHRSHLHTLIDDSLGRFETVYAAAGSGKTIFPITYDELVRVTGGKPKDLVKEA